MPLKRVIGAKSQLSLAQIFMGWWHASEASDDLEHEIQCYRSCDGGFKSVFVFSIGAIVTKISRFFGKKRQKRAKKTSTH